MINLNQIRQYFWYIFGVMGVVFFWTGIWDGVGNVSYLVNPLVSLGLGLFLFAISGFIFRGDNPFMEKENKVNSVLHHVHTHPRKGEFNVKYLDKISNKHITLEAKNLKRIENGFLVFLDKGQKEIFVPVHRVREIIHQGKSFWRY